MNIPLFIANPAQGEKAIQVRDAATRTIWITIGAIISGGLIAAAIIIFVVQMPLVAAVLVVAEVVAAVVLWQSFTKQFAARNPGEIARGSLLRGLTANTMTTPQQLWDAAVCVRDTGDKGRAQMILGV